MIGTILLFAGNYAPSGFIECNGQSLCVNEKAALYSVLGNRFGGNSVVFNVPKLDAPVGCKYILCVDGLYPSRD